MPDATDPQRPADAPPVIESASGTTSPDNENSGNGAYVVFGVVVALLAALTFGLSSCASSVARLAEVMDREDRWYYEDNDEYFDEYFDDLFGEGEELFGA